jgi:excisionase family DNA binding protein
MIYAGERHVQPEKFLYSQQEAAAALALCKRSVEYFVAKGEFETRRVGRRVLITRESLRRFAEKNHFEAVNSPPKAKILKFS